MVAQARFTAIYLRPLKSLSCSFISGEFDFIVRRTQIPDKQGKLHAVAFVEPVKFQDGPPRPNDIRYGLLPGDQLLRINGTSIDVLSRNDLSTLMEVFTAIFLFLFFMMRYLMLLVIFYVINLIN